MKTSKTRTSKRAQHKPNIIFCLSPLHILIAEQIIAQNSDRDFFGIMVTYNDNHKYRYYFDRLTARCSASRYMVLSSRHSHEVRLDIDLPTKDFASVFIASIENYQLLDFLGNISFNDISTYDDRSANLMG